MWSVAKDIAASLIPIVSAIFVADRVNCYGFGCLIVDLVEMGFWKLDEKHSVINKCESRPVSFVFTARF